MIRRKKLYKRSSTMKKTTGRSRFTKHVSLITAAVMTAAALTGCGMGGQGGASSRADGSAGGSQAVEGAGSQTSQ